MAISLQSLRRSGVPQPPRLLVYGVAGVGKTRLAASAPAPVFLQTEDGSHVDNRVHEDADGTPVLDYDPRRCPALEHEHVRFARIGDPVVELGDVA